MDPLVTSSVGINLKKCNTLISQCFNIIHTGQENNIFLDLAFGLRNISASLILFRQLPKNLVSIFSSKLIYAALFRSLSLKHEWEFVTKANAIYFSKIRSILDRVPLH